MIKPGQNDKCAVCFHNFSYHYDTFGGTKQGCADTEERGGGCLCSGFMIKYTAPRTATSHMDPREYGSQFPEDH